MTTETNSAQTSSAWPTSIILMIRGHKVKEQDSRAAQGSNLVLAQHAVDESSGLESRYQAHGGQVPPDGTTRSDSPH